MRIDSHQHFWQYDPEKHAWIKQAMYKIKRDFLPEDLDPLLKAHQLDGCVAVQADQTEEETGFLLELADRNSFIQGVVGWVDLQSDNLDDRLEYFSQFPMLKGFRHILQDEQDDQFILKRNFQRGLGQLLKYNFTYDILVFPHQLKGALITVGKFPNQPFVLDHLAKPYIKKGEISSWRKTIFEISRYENLSCKVSGLVTEANWEEWDYQDFEPYLDTVLEAFGPERLMYGSDWPVCLLAAEYPAVYNLMARFIQKLSTEEQKMIMGLNAVDFYRL